MKKKAKKEAGRSHFFRQSYYRTVSFFFLEVSLDNGERLSKFFDRSALYMAQYFFVMSSVEWPNKA